MAFKTIDSSPLEDLGQVDLTRSEMSRRMLKRSHRSEHSHTLSELDSRGISLVQERLSKRLRHTFDPSFEEPDPNSMTFEDMVQFEVNDDSQFHTPFSSSCAVDSPISKDTPLEQLSPLPVARRIFPRSDSRNFKENSVGSLSLASPFHSRPGSVASSPDGKRKSHRRVLDTKSRTLSDKRNQTNIEQNLSLSAVCHTGNSPGSMKTCLHNRRPSVPTSAHMVQEITRQDWLIPPKALSRAFLAGDFDRYSVDSPPELVIGPSALFEDLPVAASTPHHKHTGMANEYVSSMYASRSGYCTPGLAIELISKDSVTSECHYDDIVMTDGHNQASDRRCNLVSCSIVSTVTSPSTSPSAHGAPCRVSGGGSPLKLVTLRTYDFAFPHLRNHIPSYGNDNAEDSIISPLRPADYTVPLPPLSNSLDSFSTFVHSPDLLMDLVTPAWFHTDDLGFHDPVVATSDSSPKVLYSSSGAKLQDMFSNLSLDGVYHPYYHSWLLYHYTPVITVGLLVTSFSHLFFQNLIAVSTPKRILRTTLASA